MGLKSVARVEIGTEGVWIKMGEREGEYWSHGWRKFCGEEEGV